MQEKADFLGALPEGEAGINRNAGKWRRRHSEELGMAVGELDMIVNREAHMQQHS